MTDTSKPHLEQLAKDLELARNVVNYDEDYAETTYALARSLLDLYEQLEAAHANMDRYGMALAEIAEGFSRTSLNAHEAILIARGALNPASEPKEGE